MEGPGSGVDEDGDMSTSGRSQHLSSSHVFLATLLRCGGHVCKFVTSLTGNQCSHCSGPHFQSLRKSAS